MASCLFINKFRASSSNTCDAQVLRELGAPYDATELASFMSVSKGYMGECGLRGGWMELVNLQPAVQQQLFKCISAMLCPTVLGQATVDCVVCMLAHINYYRGSGRESKPTEVPFKRTNISSKSVQPHRRSSARDADRRFIMYTTSVFM